MRPKKCPHCGYHEFDRDSENIPYMMPEGAYFMLDGVKALRTDEKGDTSRSVYACPHCRITFISE